MNPSTPRGPRTPRSPPPAHQPPQQPDREGDRADAGQTSQPIGWLPHGRSSFLKEQWLGRAAIHRWAAGGQGPQGPAHTRAASWLSSAPLPPLSGQGQSSARETRPRAATATAEGQATWQPCSARRASWWGRKLWWLWRGGGGAGGPTVFVAGLPPQHGRHLAERSSCGTTR